MTLSFSELKTKADRLFRSLMHKLYPENVKCPTCSKVLPNEHMTIGHSQYRNMLSVRWDTRFATLQCGVCNNDGNKEEPLREWFRSKYKGWDDLLNEERNKLIKRFELEEIVAGLEKALKEVQHEH